MGFQIVSERLIFNHLKDKCRTQGWLGLKVIGVIKEVYIFCLLHKGQVWFNIKV